MHAGGVITVFQSQFNWATFSSSYPNHTIFGRVKTYLVMRRRSRGKIRTKSGVKFGVYPCCHAGPFLAFQCCTLISTCNIVLCICTEGNSKSLTAKFGTCNHTTGISGIFYCGGSITTMMIIYCCSFLMICWKTTLDVCVRLPSSSEWIAMKTHLLEWFMCTSYNPCGDGTSPQKI